MYFALIVLPFSYEGKVEGTCSFVWDLEEMNFN